MNDDDVHGRPPAAPGPGGVPQPYGGPPSYGAPQPYGMPQPYGGPPPGGYRAVPAPPPGYGPGLSVFPRPYKDATAAWLLWVFLAGFGVHDFYLRRTGAGVAKLVLTLVGWATTLVLVGYVPLFAVFVWWIVDAFTMNGRIQQVNAQAYAHNRAIGAAL